MVGFYIRMRVRQLLRFFSFNEINPVIGIMLLAGLFLFISEAIFQKLPYSGVVYALVAFSLLVQLQSAASNAYLLQNTDRKTFFKAKLLENTLTLAPFLLELLSHRFYLEALCLSVIIIPYSIYSFSMPRPRSVVLRTPYYRYSFEFQSGFRSYWVVYPLHLLLLLAAVLSANVYVLLVSYFFLLFFISTYYGRVEEPVFIWMYRTKATRFLLLKVKTLATQYFLTFSAFFIIGTVFFIEEVPLLLLCMLVGLTGLVGGLFMKYHFYPSEFIIQISQMLFLGIALFCMFNPPYLLLMLVIALFSFFKAKNKIKAILQC